MSLIVVIVCASCSSSGDRPAGVSAAASQAATPGATVSSADAGIEPFVEACLATSNLGQALCDCTARKARAQLSPDGFAHLTAMRRKEEARAAELRGRLSAQDLMASGTFMVRGPAECSREAAGLPGASGQQPTSEVP